MKKTNIIVLFSISCFFYGCGSDDKKPPHKKVYPVSSLKPVTEKAFDTISSENKFASESLVQNPAINKKTALTTKKAIDPNTHITALQNKTVVTTAVVKKEDSKKLMTFVNLRKILSRCKIGQTMSQKDLTQNFEIPEEAVKLVKSVTKTAENELAVKWRSTWFIEKVSDAELKDGKMKIRFAANKMFTSGNAIGIKYNRKIYNDLIIIGHSAYIPSVKGYSWQIGK